MTNIWFAFYSYNILTQMFSLELWIEIAFCTQSHLTSFISVRTCPFLFLNRSQELCLFIEWMDIILNYNTLSCIHTENKEKINHYAPHLHSKKQSIHVDFLFDSTKKFVMVAILCWVLNVFWELRAYSTKANNIHELYLSTQCINKVLLDCFLT